MNFNLRVSKVLVTGGGSGIGEAIGEALLREGCHVCICGRNVEKLEKAKERINNERLSIMQWDVRDIALFPEKVNEAACLCGGYLDGFVNNAGIYLRYKNPQWGDFNESEEDWDSTWDTNLKAPVIFMRKFSTYLNQNHLKGNILNISSIAGNEMNISKSYNASKYALTKMTRAHAKKVVQFGIVINGILPGITFSEINPSDTGYAQKYQAIGRIIQPEEIADIALFLMSDAAKICIGEMMIADGGAWNAN
jgi:NAD(P)-dependent dehydrogenase (short-subunit alcohol dehydrogenase family)